MIKGVNTVLGFRSVFRSRLLPSLSRAMGSAQWSEVKMAASIFLEETWSCRDRLHVKIGEGNER